MKYLNKSFDITPALKIEPGTCQRCVYGTGDHATDCRAHSQATRPRLSLTNCELETIPCQRCVYSTGEHATDCGKAERELFRESLHGISLTYFED